jgi:hypothetical protein
MLIIDGNGEGDDADEVNGAGVNEDYDDNYA